MLQLLSVRCKRLLNPVLSINEFNASQSYPTHKMQLIIFMYNYHTVLSYSVSIHTSKASLISQNSCLSIHKKEVPIILVADMFLHIHGAKCFSKKCRKFTNFIFNNYICGPGLSNRNVSVLRPCIYAAKLLRNYTLDIPTLLVITSMENKFSTEKIKLIFWPTAISPYFCS